MIPKIIHYCWLSNDPIPKDLVKYLKTWKKYLPDYEFIKWDFSRFDINSSVWVKEAFENKKYAFAADYIRMYALYTMGGIYLDMDVEVLKSYDELLDLDYFVCYENSTHQLPEAATLGACRGCEWIGKVLNYYKGRHFVKEDGSFDNRVLPLLVKTIILENEYIIREISEPKDYLSCSSRDFAILPYDYFSPKSYFDGRIEKTTRSFSIHQFSGSWMPWEQRIERKMWIFFGLKPHRIMWHFDQFLAKYFSLRR